MWDVILYILVQNLPLCWTVVTAIASSHSFKAWKGDKVPDDDNSLRLVQEFILFVHICSYCIHSDFYFEPDE